MTKMSRFYVINLGYKWNSFDSSEKYFIALLQGLQNLVGLKVT